MKALTFIPVLFASVLAAGSYSNCPDVYELTPKTFDKVIFDSNYTTIAKFYAPWCGYCQQLDPIYRKVGRYFLRDAKYAVNVVAINCDEEENKPLCGRYHIKSFPTVMVFRPPKFNRETQSKNGKHVPETFNGQRDLPSIVEFVNSRMKNYVKKFHRLSSKSFGEWLDADDGLEKVVSLSNAPNVSPLLKSLAIDFLDTASVGTVPVKEVGDNLVVAVEGTEVHVPITAEDKLPILLVYKKDEQEFVRFEEKKLNNLAKLEKFVMGVFNITPSEGSLSKRGRKLLKLRSVKEKVKEELKEEKVEAEGEEQQSEKPLVEVIEPKVDEPKIEPSVEEPKIELSEEKEEEAKPPTEEAAPEPVEEIKEEKVPEEKDEL